MAGKSKVVFKNNLIAQIEKITGEKTNAAIYAILSQGAAISVAKTPIDTGFLVNSMYAPVIVNYGAKSFGHVGYTANYAAAVHEKKGTLKGQPRPKRNGKSSGNYWDPSGEPNFLKKGFDELKPYIPAILKNVYG